jgi:transmembrane sensor
MSRLPDGLVHEQAIAWHLAIEAEDFDDWDGFVAWLEADPRHNTAYEGVADADAGLARIADLAPAQEPRSDRQPANDAGVAQPWWRSARRGAVAATIALVGVGSWIGYGRVNGLYTVTTPPGETRTLALADGTRIALNGATRVVLDKRDLRFAELLSGEAKFSVRHDAADPFELTVADQKIVDVGTVFNVQKNTRVVRVEVAEGSVRYEDGQVRLRLNAGDTLQASGDAIVEGSRPVEAIGSWTQGRLVYRDQPLVDVVTDLARARGIAIELGPNLAHQNFTGVIQLDGDAETVRKRLAQLLALKVSDTSDGWSISK